MNKFFLRMICSLVFLNLIYNTPVYSSDANSGANQINTRETFNENWLFARFGTMPDRSTKAEPQGLETEQVDDTLWRKLDLPHDWGIEGPFQMGLPSGTGKLPWAGIGWYRKHFKISPEDRDKRFFIDFDGAMSHAKVWLNGKYIGEWPYGYSSFRFELTSQLYYNKENVVAVRIDNPPNSSRWYPGGGIYRNVWLVKTSPVHIANCGIFITTPKVTKRDAVIHVRAEIENQYKENAKIKVSAQISEPGRTDVIAAKVMAKLKISGGSKGRCEAEIILRSPKLWDVESPNLYCLKTTIEQNDRVVDITETTFGVREAKFSPDSGFILNGRRVGIKGVCNHHDLGILGTAVNKKALERQIRILKEMGCNAIRTSHNPPAPELLDLCDRTGMLILDEAFDCWKKAKTQNDYSNLFEKWHERDIRALVRRDRNHPCVIMWSSGNEVWEQDNAELSRHLRDIFLSEDSTRPVTVACNGEESGFNGFQNSLDVFGFNYKTYQYTKFHQLYPSKPFIGTETASCVSTNGEYFFPVDEDKSKGFLNCQVSSYDLYAPPWAYPPDVEFEAQDKNTSVAGEFVWTGFDYLGEPTPFGDDTLPSRSSYFGIMDLCGFKKDRFYIYQARWRPDLPMVHILPHWNWPERIGQVTPVHVYTSGNEAELFLNGQSLGRKKKEPYKYRLRWDDVKYAPGELKVIAYKNGKEWASDVLKTTYPAERLVLSAESSEICANGRDLVFITTGITDKNGSKIPTADNLIRFSVNGPGLIAAVGNGDPTDHGSFQSDSCRAFHGQCLVVVRSVKGKKGIIRIKAEADKLLSEEIEIMSK